MIKAKIWRNHSIVNVVDLTIEGYDGRGNAVVYAIVVYGNGNIGAVKADDLKVIDREFIPKGEENDRT
jgi:hypothetical protein